ncbi:MAG TPA: hypothetical protein VF331_03280 [Polyangiales bacterium]
MSLASINDAPARRLGIDSRLPASLYFASDSRISWAPSEPWNHAQKLFVCRDRADMFGYVGDVLFPVLALSQLVVQIDAGFYFAQGVAAGDHAARILATLQRALDAYPKSQRREFTIVYGTRDGEVMSSAFSVWTFNWTPNCGWTSSCAALPTSSGVVTSLGSGRKFVETWSERWNNTSEKGTSRAVFSSFCDALSAGGDALSGGAPQLVGLYRKGHARRLGVVYQGKPYLCGFEAEAVADDRLEWRNTSFERCDRHGIVLPSAQRHRVPRGLGVRTASAK